MKRILVGITQEDELYFLEVEPTNDQLNGYDEFSMSGFTVKPITEAEAKENAHNWLEDEGDYFWRQAVGAKSTTLGLDEWIEQVKSEDEMGNFDNSLFPEEVEYDGETWLFESQSCGQHEESDFKHYFISEATLDALMHLWNRYHCKPTPKPDTIDGARLADILAIEQDIPALAVQAIEIINA